MKIIGIIGAGDLGQLIAYHAIADRHFDSAVFFDDYKEKGEVVDGHTVIGKIADAERAFSHQLFSHIIIAIGYKHLNARKAVFEKLAQLNIPFANIIHSSSYIDESCNLGKGVFILPGCTIDRNVVIGNNVVLNTACTVAHDTKIGAHCFLSPRVAVAGFCVIEPQCLLGINCTIIDNIFICSQTQIGGGGVVVKSIGEPGLYVGVPAKKNRAFIV